MALVLRTGPPPELPPSKPVGPTSETVHYLLLSHHLNRLLRHLSRPSGLLVRPNTLFASTLPALFFLKFLGFSSSFSPFGLGLFSLLIIAEKTAPPAKLPAALNVPALSKPKNLRNNFSAGIRKYIAITAYTKLVVASSIAAPTNTVYSIK